MSDLVLITGGAGMLGQVLAPLLVDAGYRVRSADVRPIEDAPEDVEFVEADIRTARPSRSSSHASARSSIPRHGTGSTSGSTRRRTSGT
jgi:nucleoside-diphosphate-sugar epimerase